MTASWREHLAAGQVIPACPLTLEADGSWSTRHQRALVRYYLDAGAGGIAVGVHTTQFAIRDPRHELYEPVLRLVGETIDQYKRPDQPFIRVAGICGDTDQAIAEAELAKSLGFELGLLATGASAGATEADVLRHCRAVAEVIPLFGFFLQAAVGGRTLSYRYWRQFAEIDSVAAIKIAAFNRYHTLDVVRAVIDSGRDDLALYTGNDDNIIADLLTRFRFDTGSRWIVGGLLGQWAVWTRRAVEMLQEIKQHREQQTVPLDWISRAAALTDANAAIFDAAGGFAGCIPGVHEVLRGVGLTPSTRCLDPREVLSPGQAEQIQRVTRLYPDFNDDAFVRANLHRWLDS
jgi:dihydrodipicolinate synthase/N-acetylneuraminate lyase